MRCPRRSILISNELKRQAHEHEKCCGRKDGQVGSRMKMKFKHNQFDSTLEMTKEDSLAMRKRKVSP